MPFSQPVSVRSHYSPDALMRNGATYRAVLEPGWYVFAVESAREITKRGENMWVLNLVDSRDPTNRTAQWLALKGTKHSFRYKSNFNTLVSIAHGIGLEKMIEASDLVGGVFICKLDIETWESQTADGEAETRSREKIMFCPTPEELANVQELTAKQRADLKRYHAKAIKDVAKGAITIFKGDDDHDLDVPALRGLSAEEMGL